MISPRGWLLRSWYSTGAPVASVTTIPNTITMVMSNPSSDAWSTDGLYMPTPDDESRRRQHHVRIVLLDVRPELGQVVRKLVLLPVVQRSRLNDDQRGTISLKKVQIALLPVLSGHQPG